MPGLPIECFTLLEILIFSTKMHISKMNVLLATIITSIPTVIHYYPLYHEILKYWVGVQCVSLTSGGECASVALVGHPSSDGVTIKMPYGVDLLLHQPALNPIFSC